MLKNDLSLAGSIFFYSVVDHYFCSTLDLRRRLPLLSAACFVTDTQKEFVSLVIGEVYLFIKSYLLF